MSEIIKMVEAELKKINLQEQRDDRIKYDPHFIFERKGLFLVMWITFFLTIFIMYNSEYFNRLEIGLCTVFFLMFNSFFVFHINPSYHLKDVDKISWRNCYTGEWYREIAVPNALVEDILNSKQVPLAQKSELQRLLTSCGTLRFIDLIEIARI
jgi:hypothetical protein